MDKERATLRVNFELIRFRQDSALSCGMLFYHKSKRYGLKVVLNCEKIKGKSCSWLLATDLGLSAGSR